MRPGSNRGKENFQNKLTEEDVIFIFTCSSLSQSELASRFSVSQSTINHIKRQRTWKWLTDQHKKATND